MKNKITTIIIVSITVLLAGIAIFTAFRLYKTRDVAVAPNVPSSQPLASFGDTCNPRIINNCDHGEECLQVGSDPTRGFCGIACNPTTLSLKCDERSGINCIQVGTNEKKGLCGNDCKLSFSIEATTDEPNVAACINVTAYSTAWVALTSTQLSQLDPEDKVNFCVAGFALEGEFTKAKFTINGSVLPETTVKRPSSTDYCQEFTIPENVTAFDVKAEITHATLGAATNSTVAMSFCTDDPEDKFDTCAGCSGGATVCVPKGQCNAHFKACDTDTPNLTCRLSFSNSTTATVTPTGTARATATATPVPQCNASCTSNTQCPSGLMCYIPSGSTAGNCRNTQCLSETDCLCPTTTNPPTTAPTDQPELPVVGTSWPTMLGTAVGILVIIGSLMLAL